MFCGFDVVGCRFEVTLEGVGGIAVVCCIVTTIIDCWPMQVG